MRRRTRAVVGGSDGVDGRIIPGEVGARRLFGGTAGLTPERLNTLAQALRDAADDLWFPLREIEWRAQAAGQRGDREQAEMVVRLAENVCDVLRGPKLALDALLDRGETPEGQLLLIAPTPAPKRAA